MKKIISLFLVVLTAFCSCDDVWVSFGGRTESLSKGHRPKFHKGDTFYYYSEQTHLTDTFVVDKLQYAFHHSMDDKYEKVIYSFTRANKSQTEEMSFSFEYCEIGYLFLDCTVGDLTKSYYLSGFCEGDAVGDRYEGEVVDADEPFPTSIYHSGNKGIMGYTYSDSITYIITNPIK